MSTKCSIAGVTLVETINGEEFHANVHLYTECFDEDPQPVYLTVSEQGVWSNRGLTLCIPQDKALQFADELTAWAASARNEEGPSNADTGKQE